MKRFAVMALTTLVIAGCGGGSTETVACAQQFWNNIFATCLPEGWKVLAQDTLTSLGVPEETVAVFQREEPSAGQIDTVTVVREPLPIDMETPDYSKANILAVSALSDYKLIDKKAVFVDGKESSIHVFSGRPDPASPVRRYYQLSAAVERTGYTFTGSFPLSIDDSEANDVEFILGNVSFVNPKGEAAAAAE